MSSLWQVVRFGQGLRLPRYESQTLAECDDSYGKRVRAAAAAIRSSLTSHEKRMSASSAKPTACLGFLSVVENVELGLLGGYLLLNASGRPLEFHCTAPVKANRTQEILYGPTLKPYLYGEQIGQTLLGKSRLLPVAICTDCEAILTARDFTQLPFVQVLKADSNNSGFAVGNNRLVTAPHYAGDEKLIRNAWPAQAEHLDLLEPFLRIREALEEAHRTAKLAA
jgi:hypothetical protein